MRMRIFRFITTVAIICCMAPIYNADAQRRARPNSMKHADTEVKDAMKSTKVNATYIHDGARFSGPVYMVGEAGGIKIGNSVLTFKGGKYYINYTAGEFSMREASTRDERRKKGISEFAYEHSWKNEKLGSDFDYSGKYEVVEQYGNIHLILYDGTSDNVFAKIPLDSAKASSFEFAEDDFLFKFSK